MDLLLVASILLVVSLISYVEEIMTEPPSGFRAGIYALALAESFVCITLLLKNAAS